MGNEKTRKSCPRVDAVASFLTYSLNVGPVEYLKSEPESTLKLILPLEKHRRRTSNYDFPYPATEQQFAGYKPSLDGLAEADVIGDEKIDAGEQKCFPERFQLIGVDLNARPKRRLKESRIGGGYAVPAKGMEEGAEKAGLIKALLADGLPGFVAKDLGVELKPPDNFEFFPLGIVVKAGKADNRIGSPAIPLGSFNQIGSGSYSNDLAGLWGGLRFFFSTMHECASTTKIAALHYIPDSAATFGSILTMRHNTLST
jgi:hypothetical protein